MEFEEFAKREEEVAWRQRSRTLWIKQRDKNSKFFRELQMLIAGIIILTNLVVDGEEIEEVTDIKKEIISFYQNLYSETEEWRPLAYNMNFEHAIIPKENQEMQKPFEEREVLDGLKLYAVDKAPGVDGYTMGFFCQILGNYQVRYHGYSQLFPFP